LPSYGQQSNWNPTSTTITLSGSISPLIIRRISKSISISIPKYAIVNKNGKIVKKKSRKANQSSIFERTIGNLFERIVIHNVYKHLY